MTISNGRWLIRGAALFILAAVCLVVVIRLAGPGIDKRHLAALSWSLVDRVVVVDPGHGGMDPGAKGKGGSVEKDIAFSISKKLARLITQGGAKVIMTRETDKMLYDPGTQGFRAKKRQDLGRRADIANDNGAAAFISIHLNSFPSDTSQHGAQTFSQPGSGESKILSQCIQTELVSRLGNNKRQPKEVDFFTNRRAKMPAVIVEVGFLSNPAEEKLLMSEEYQEKVAFAIYAGLVKYFSETSAPQKVPLGKA